ncbi:MAG: NUDIX hydrolase [Oscillospiraceae bacterium]|nr:NUDIX hydrolase [Oscillospiraceae bacterium]
MELKEKKLSGETVFDGKIMHVRCDTVLLPDGTLASREVVDHPGGVGVLALDNEKNVLVVSQYRYPYGRVLREIPAGKLEYGEDPEAAARRELREETGAVAGRFEWLGELYPTPGYCDEIVRMYLARDLTFGETDLDEGEFLNLERVPFDTLVEQVLHGEIRDAKTVAAVLKAKILLNW